MEGSIRFLAISVALAALAGCTRYTPPPRHDLIYQGEGQYRKEWRQRNADSAQLRAAWERWEAGYGHTYDNNRLYPAPYKD